MILEIEPLTGYGWDCLVGHIAAVASFWQCNYLLAFAKSWTFIRNCLPNSTTSEIYAKLAKDAVSLEDVIKFSNIKLHYYENIPYNEASSIILDQLNNQSPVIVACDTFCCPWFSSSYHSVHAFHFFLIIGFDNTTDEYYCTDASLMKYQVKISSNDLENGFVGKLHTFSRVKDNLVLPQESDYYFNIKNSAKAILDASTGVSQIEILRIFGEKFIDLYNMSLEELNTMADKNMVCTTLFRHIVLTIQSRQHFTKLLKYVGETFNENYIAIYEGMEQSVEMWKIIGLILHKTNGRNGNINLLKTATKKIKEVAKLEEEIAKKILSV